MILIIIIISIHDSGQEIKAINERLCRPPPLTTLRESRARVSTKNCLDVFHSNRDKQWGGERSLLSH